MRIHCKTSRLEQAIFTERPHVMLNDAWNRVWLQTHSVFWKIKMEQPHTFMIDRNRPTIHIKRSNRYVQQFKHRNRITVRDRHQFDTKPIWADSPDASQVEWRIQIVVENERVVLRSRSHSLRRWWPLRLENLHVSIQSKLSRFLCEKCQTDANNNDYWVIKTMFN